VSTSESANWSDQHQLAQTSRIPGRVSVVVPTCNRPALLREALRSVREVQGTDLDIEIIVVDNAATWDAQQVALDFGAKYLRNPVPGVAATRNAGADLATGEYLAFLDDDDLWMSSHIRPHLALLKSDTSLGGALGQQWFVDQTSLRPLGPPYPSGLAPTGGAFRTLLDQGIQIGSLLIRASAWDAVGPFDSRWDAVGPFNRRHTGAPTRIAVDDWDWCLRLALRFPLGFIDEPCILYRIRPPTPECDKRISRTVAITRRVFWTNIRRAGSQAPSLLSATRISLRHDGGVANMLLSNAQVYLENDNRPSARRAILLAGRAAPLHIVWRLARSSWMRGFLRQALRQDPDQRSLTHP
jgi:glycosyltransferase involved in cell wall biosynthesis